MFFSDHYYHTKFSRLDFWTTHHLLSLICHVCVITIYMQIINMCLECIMWLVMLLYYFWPELWWWHNVHTRQQESNNSGSVVAQQLQLVPQQLPVNMSSTGIIIQNQFGHQAVVTQLVLLTVKLLNFTVSVVTKNNNKNLWKHIGLNLMKLHFYGQDKTVCTFLSEIALLISHKWTVMTDIITLTLSWNIYIIWKCWFMHF